MELRALLVSQTADTSDAAPLLPDIEQRRVVLFLARNVADARRQAGLTQFQLARAADLSRATIHLIEAGACDPKLSTVASLAKALKRTTLSLLVDQFADGIEAGRR